MKRILVIVILGIVGACSAPVEPEVFTATVDVDEAELPDMLAAMDRVTDNALDLPALQELAVSTPMDDELQLRFDARFSGKDTTVLYHVWREQADWVHVYTSSESEALIEAIKTAIEPFARE